MEKPRQQLPGESSGIRSGSSPQVYDQQTVSHRSQAPSPLLLDQQQQQQQQQQDFAPALTRAFKERLRPCLNALDGLRSQGLQREISLPAIAVVGDQSVGKSSVLEAISGVEFPRGLGIVTRCPLMLCMRGREDAGWSARIRYETKSGEARDKPLSTPAAVGQAIREAQEEMTKPGEVSEKMIELHIEGSDSPDLTLIDLPGIARFSIASGGDIANVTKSLIMSQIEKPEVLILVVIPCNVDVETVEAVSLAREVDPESKRTLGVLTCPDLVNPGSEMEVLAMMRNERLKLLKGFVTVRCRTPQQLKDNVSLQDACKAEEEFFRQHPQFCALHEYQWGSRTLANKLSVELYEAVRMRVPDILKEIQVKREEYLHMLEDLGIGPQDSGEGMTRLLVTMIEEFKKEFQNAAEGTHRHEDSRIYGPCRKHWETLADAMEDCAFSDTTDSNGVIQQLRLEVENQRGSELLGYDNIYPVLQRLVRTHFLKSLRPHTALFLLSVTQEVDTTLRALSDRVFGQFPCLNRLIKQEAEVIKTEMLDRSRKQMEEIFEQEGFVFSQDRIFSSELMRPTIEKLQTKKPQPSTEQEVIDSSAENRANHPADVTTRNAQRVLDGAEAYMRVTVRRLQDTIPMAVIHYMLHKLSNNVSHRLGILLTDVRTLYPMLQEDPEIGSQRQHLMQLLEKLLTAEKELIMF